MLLNKLHPRDLETYGRNKNLLAYDKMGQMHKVVNIVRTNFMGACKLEKFLTVHEMMIQYKGSYFPACQYMPKNVKNGESKLWCFVDTKSKFVHNFNIYCGQNGLRDGKRNIDGQVARTGKPKFAHNVVMKLIEGNEGKGHCIVMDNFFSSIGHFEDLE